MYRKPVFLITLFCLLLSVNSFAENTDSTGTSEFTAKSASGNAFVLEIAANPIQTMQAQPARIIVTGANGAAISGINLDCNLEMPSMAMGNNSPPVKETPQAGTYESLFLFTMGGDWIINCTADYANQVTENIVFEVNDIPHSKMGGMKDHMNKMLGEKDMPHMQTSDKK